MSARLRPEEVARRVDMALAEAGFPDALVGVEPCPLCARPRVSVTSVVTGDIREAAARAMALARDLPLRPVRLAEEIRASGEPCDCTDVYLYDEVTA